MLGEDWTVHSPMLLKVWFCFVLFHAETFQSQSNSTRAYISLFGHFFVIFYPLPFCIHSVPVLYALCIRSISVLYPFRSHSHTHSVSVPFPFVFAFPVRFLLIGTVSGNSHMGPWTLSKILTPLVATYENHSRKQPAPVLTLLFRPRVSTYMTFDWIILQGLPVISPPGSFATKRPSRHQPSHHQAKSTRHQ